MACILWPKEGMLLMLIIQQRTHTWQAAPSDKATPLELLSVQGRTVGPQESKREAE